MSNTCKQQQNIISAILEGLQKPLTVMGLASITGYSSNSIRRYIKILKKNQKIRIAGHKVTILGGLREVYGLGNAKDAILPQGPTCKKIDYNLLKELILKKLPMTSPDLAGVFDVSEQVIRKVVKELRDTNQLDSKEYPGCVPAVHFLPGNEPPIPAKLKINMHSAIQVIPWAGYNQQMVPGEIKTTWRHHTQ